MQHLESATSIWVLTNRKSDRRRGLVQLIDATDLYRKMKKSLGSKRNELGEEHIDTVLGLFTGMKEGENVKVFPTTAFGFRKVQVDRPLRLSFTTNDERLAHLAEESSFVKLTESRKKKEELKRAEEEEGRQPTSAITRSSYSTRTSTRANRRRTQNSGRGDCGVVARGCEVKCAPPARPT